MINMVLSYIWAYISYISSQQNDMLNNYEGDKFIDHQQK